MERREADVVERRRVLVLDQAVDADPDQDADHTSAGITALGWRAAAPFFGVTTKEPLLRSTVNTVARHVDPEVGGGQREGREACTRPPPASAAVVSATAK